MSDDQETKHRSQADAELEQEIRQDRKFTLEEGIIRLAGPGMMKGQSPVSRREQSEAAIESYLRSHLIDAEGTLPYVLLRNVSNSELLVENYDEPLVVLGTYLQQMLDSDYMLSELVRQADAEWGRLLGERPHFELAGATPHPDDPYTLESVRKKLNELAADLTVARP